MKDLTSTHIHTKLSVYADATAKIAASVRNQVGPRFSEVGNYLTRLYIHQWQHIHELK